MKGQINNFLPIIQSVERWINHMEILIFKSGSMSRLPQSSQNQFCGPGPVAISLPKTTLQNHSRQIQKKVSPLPLRCFPQVLVNNEVPMLF